MSQHPPTSSPSDSQSHSHNREDVDRVNLNSRLDLDDRLHLGDRLDLNSRIGPPRDNAFYPFVELDIEKQNALEAGIELLDFGLGDPTDETPAFIREALANAITPRSSYPRATGQPALRNAIASWAKRRFDVVIDPDTSILPTLGSKEVIHSLAAYVLDGQRNLIAVPYPSYPIYERGVNFHGTEVLPIPLLETNGFLPDLSAVSAQTWERTALLWLNYPNNPTGACATMELYEQAARLAKKHNFFLASDEAYSEIYFDTPPVSALQLADLTNVVVVNTLSKRSCMTGYRSGFIAGDPSLIERMRNYRPSVGATPQDFVQTASVEAWNDETHVQEMRQRWGAKRSIFVDALDQCGLKTTGDATFFLWSRVPDSYTSQEFSKELLSLGLVTSPGTFFGDKGEGFIRWALVPSLENCERAAEILIKQSWK